MVRKNIAVIMLYTDDNMLLMQDREGISKFGEEWCFFGGQIEEGETADEALVREIKEELDYDLQDYEYFKTLKGNDDRSVTVYIKNITKDLDKLTVLEGAGMKLFTPSEAKNLKLMKWQTPFMIEVEKYFKEKKL